MKKVLIQIILILSPIYVQSQNVVGLEVSTGKDSISEKHGFWHKPKIILGLGGHNSLVAGEKVRIGGMRLGLEFNHKWRFGVGLNYLSPPIHRLGGTEQSPIFYQIDFGYINIFGEYIFLNNRRWELSVPVVIGGGGTTISSRTDENDVFVPDRGVTLTVRKISGVGYYKIWKWLGLGLSLGYRDVSSESEKDPKLAALVAEAFDGPTWAIKTKIYVGELFRAIFKKKKKGKTETIDRGTLDTE